MELDDLKALWSERDRAAAVRFRLEGAHLRKAESAVRRHATAICVGLALNLGVLLWLGSFAADHASEVRFFAPAAFLAAGAVALLVTAVRQLVRISRVDYGGPIVEIQKALAEMKKSRVRQTKATLLLAALAWTPLLVVSLRSLLGVDAYASFGWRWILVNAAFGLAAIPLGLGLSRALARRPGAARLLRRIADDLAGPSLAAAKEQLRAVEEFEAEELPGRP